jgi:hypothetical protein
MGMQLETDAQDCLEAAVHTGKGFQVVKYRWKVEHTFA